MIPSVLGLLALLGGCDATAVFTQSIGPDGGTIDAGDVQLAIPAGALESDVEIGVEEVSDLEAAGYTAAPDYIDGAPLVSVSLTPHGTTFAEPITLTLPFDGARDDLVLLRLDDDQDTSWEAVGPLTFGDGTVSVQIDHFSAYTLANVAAGSCPCFNGADVEAVGAYAASSGYTMSSYDYGATTAVSAFSTTSTAPGEISAGLTDIYTPGQVSCAALVTDGPTALADMTAVFPRLAAGTPAPGPVSLLAGYFGFFQPVSATEEATCRALVRAAITGSPGVQIGFTATGLPVGDSVVVVDPTGNQITISADDQIDWAIGLVPVGGAYTTSIATQPAGATCTLGGTASGTAGADNINVAIDCVAAATPQCTMSWTSGTGALGTSFSGGGGCQLITDGTILSGIFLHDAPLSLATLDIESVSSWDDYINARGGSVVALLQFAPLANGNPPNLAIGSGEVHDFTGIGGAGLGLWELDDVSPSSPGSSTWNLTALDTTQQTFRVEIDALVQGGEADWPPLEDAPGSDHVGYPDATGGATIVIEGGWTPYP